MKEKILLFIIGVLVGAIISTGVFFVLSSNNNPGNGPQMQMPGGQPPQMPDGQQPPSMSSSNTSQAN